MNFDELIKDEAVANHPLFANRQSMIKAMRNMMVQHKEALDVTDLTDAISGKGDSFSRSKISDVIKKSIEVLHGELANLNFPMMPKLNFSGVKDAKYASYDSEEIMSCRVSFVCRTKTANGVLRTFTVDVPVKDGEVIPPSIMTFEGRDHVIAQSSVDELINRFTQFNLPRTREMYDPPMNHDERQLAVDTRNEMGWQPQNYNSSVFTNSRVYKKSAHNLVMEMVTNHPEIDNTIFYSKKGSVATDLVNQTWFLDIVNAVEEKHGLVDSKKVAEHVEDFIASEQRKSALRTPPPQYGLVVELMEEAEEEGKDTFPRPYQHLLFEYILQVVDVAEVDTWMTHLVNDGYCISPTPYANIKRKKAQMIDMDIEEEKEFDLIDEDPPMENPKRLYNNTKTPIDLEDAIKFNGHGGPIHAVITEMNEEEDFIIVKSKGLEYRVHVDDIEPLPRTFKKMTHEGSKDLIPGGLADKKEKSDFPADQMITGIDVEMEHTDDKDIAEEIAMDHLTEDKEYYTKLDKMEKGSATDYNYWLDYSPEEETAYLMSDNFTMADIPIIEVEEGKVIIKISDAIWNDEPLENMDIVHDLMAELQYKLEKNGYKVEIL